MISLFIYLVNEIYTYTHTHTHIYIYVPTYVFVVVKWADGFSGVPRISLVLGRTVFFLLRLAARRDLEKDD